MSRTVCITSYLKSTVITTTVTFVDGSWLTYIYKMFVLLDMGVFVLRVHRPRRPREQCAGTE